MIRNNRDLEWEEKFAGEPCKKLDGTPPCIFSVNAFGKDTLNAYADPPVFFRSGERTHWPLPPATVCVWPYELMYNEGAYTGNSFDYDKRLSQAKEFFNKIENGKSLIFHCTNYSNPFSDDNASRYAIVGVSRVKQVGDFVFLDGTDDETKRKYGGAYIWQLNVRL